MAKGELKDKMTPQEFREYLAKVESGKQSKYGAIQTTTSDGETFKSTLEATYYSRLKVLQKVGEVTNIEREVRYEFHVNGIFVGTYLLDFRITYATGVVEHIDCKSQPTVTPLFRIKKQLMKACHGIDVVEVYK